MKSRVDSQSPIPSSPIVEPAVLQYGFPLSGKLASHRGWILPPAQ